MGAGEAQKDFSAVWDEVALKNLRSILVATFVTATLAGVNLQQLVTYVSRSRYDAPWLKLTVAVVSTLSWIDTCFTLYTLDSWVIVNNGDYATLDRFGVPFALHPVLVGAIAAVCQCFYAWRIYVLSRRSPYSPILIILLALASLGSGASTSLALLEARAFSKDRATPLVNALTLWFPAACDLAIFVQLIWILSALVAASEGTDVTYIFEKLVRLAIETNFLTFCLAFAAGILFIIGSPRYLFLPLPFIIGRVYEATLLYSVNSRIVTTAATPVSPCDTSLPIITPVRPVPSTDYIQLVSRMKRQEERLRGALKRESEEFVAKYRRSSMASREPGAAAQATSSVALVLS
ncbi:uncharacterized protein L969DRAFT_93390 [Mixia osmundae IAM 14324]|uniref:DUF6534 domain-containing protein n=1 Tax=Mixia osmundae (strain CBS 9802 / IAM 14324 / JCM 22182 / KY 12970) TaxID=764103 RepID=G7EAN8_MIXOS|nr:uncharacterized protein L969DRAFT_93390 [Mixia osmundae IAM 14324]KEI40867.1 hypothetical protein L969DRAFT_93390 [Mixia osmundae IAM 14324]GAA99898.1 hypothetical protein E5Q_06601 [Mixia osmundae IAM 14324]